MTYQASQAVEPSPEVVLGAKHKSQSKSPEKSVEYFPAVQRSLVKQRGNGVRKDGELITLVDELYTEVLLCDRSLTSSRFLAWHGAREGMGDKSDLQSPHLVHRRHKGYQIRNL